MDKVDNSKQHGKLAWFAFHPTDFAGEVQDLTQEEVGAYILLACYLAQMGGLPTDDAKLARIARCKSIKDWKAMRQSVEPLLFPDGRLATEISKSHARREERAATGRKGGLARSSSAQAQLQAQLNQPQPQPEPEREEAYQEGTSTLEGSSSSGEGSATEKEEELTRAGFTVLKGGRS